MSKRLFKNALDVSNDAYHNDTTRVSKSGLDQLNRSAAHYYAKYLDRNAPPFKRTEVLMLGAAIHASVFEPGSFEKKYVAVPNNAPRRPTAAQYMAKNPSEQTIKDVLYWQKFDHANRKREQMTLADFELCLRIRDRVHMHPGAKTLLSKGGYTENTFHFTEPNTKVKCKIRPDFISKDRFIVDLKTTDDARKNNVLRSVIKYRYDIQDAFYFDGFKLATGIEPEGFIFIFVEKEYPLNVGLYYLDGEDRDNARRVYIEDLQRYKEAKKLKEWRGYEPTITHITLPQFTRI